MSRKFPKIYRLITVLADFSTVILAFFMSIPLRNYALGEEFAPVGYLDFPILFIYIVILWWVILLFFDVAEGKRFTSFRREMRIGILTTLIGISIMFGIGFLTKYYYPRSIIVSFSICFICLWVLQKIIGYQIALKLRKARNTPILVVGAGNRAISFYEDMDTDKGNGCKIVGFLAVNEERIGQKIAGDHHIIGSFSQLAEILEAYLIEEVFFVLEPRRFGFLESLMKTCSEAGINSRLIYNAGKSDPYKGRSDVVAGYPCINFTRLPQEETGLFIKRVFDIFVSALLLMVLSPVFLIIAIVIKLTSKGRVFFPWKVVGTNNRDFVGYKFRTMVENAEKLKESLAAQNEMNGPVFKIKDDPRITQVGKWLRKFSLDELPQLWSVLKGDMSLVGPRPPNRNELNRYEFWQRRKISFKPGITCLWQVDGRNHINDFNDWCKLDLKYIDNWSLWLDFKILVKTAWVVVKGTGC